MNDATLMVLRANLKSLKLSTMARDMEVHLRQARESGIGNDEGGKISAYKASGDIRPIGDAGS